MYTLKVSNEAQQEFKKLQRSGNKGLLKKLEEILLKPKLKGKLLRGDLAGFRSVRAKPFRIVYAVDEDLKIVEIIKLDTRDDVYD